MSDNEIYPADPQDTVDLAELDDVEGHGLKEVAAGLGAAAVLAGGAASIASVSHTASADVHASKGGPGISVQVQDPIGTVNDAVDGSIAAVQAERDAALGTATHGLSSTGNMVDNKLAQATALAGDALEWTGDVADATTHAAVDITKNTRATATSTVAKTTAVAGNQVVKANTTATSTQSTASTTAGKVTNVTERKVATVLNVTTTTAAGGIHTAVVTVRSADAGAGASTAGGWVLIKAGDQVLAQVQLHNGSATASWTMPVAGHHNVTVSYTGDNGFAPSLRTITL